MLTAVVRVIEQFTADPLKSFRPSAAVSSAADPAAALVGEERQYVLVAVVVVVVGAALLLLLQLYWHCITSLTAARCRLVHVYAPS